MDYTLEFVLEHGYVILTTSGTASIGGFRQMHIDMVSHPSWARGLNLLMDHRGLNSTNLGGEEVRQLALWRGDLRKLAQTAKLASVVETDLGYGLMRMWEAYTESFLKAEHQIFGSLEEAKEWLEGDSAPA